MAGKLIHEILPVGWLQCNCSILGDPETREALVVDPGDEVERILEVLRKHSLTVRAIVSTHAHIDHVGGLSKLQQVTGAPVLMHGDDLELYRHLDVQAAWLGMRTAEAPKIDVPARDGDRLVVGATAFHVMDTPGHTPGSISLWIPSEQKVVAGDTLFRNSIGRTDLPGGDGLRILQSIHDKLMPLPEETVVVTGHGENTTIGREKRHNYFLQGL